MTTKKKNKIDGLWIQFKADMSDELLRNQLVERYLPLVKYNADRVWARVPDAVELGDLIQAGVFGLMDAIEAFDLQRGVKFETYCVSRIKGAMLDQLRALDWIPRLVRSKAHKLDAARKTLEVRLGRPASDEEMAEQLELTMPEYEKMVRDAAANSLVSLSKKWYETDSNKELREIDILEDKKGEDPLDGVQRSDVMDMVTRGLSRNERLIILLYYYEEMTMKEIGATLNLSESRVSQMHSGILARLQGQLGPRRNEMD